MPANAVSGEIVSVDDRFPVSRGHVLILPRRHEQDYFRLELGEQQLIWELVAAERDRLADELGTQSFTIGINAGMAAGQTVGHAHVHLIPRFDGDVEDPRGGVRGVIPQRRLY